MLQQLGCQTLSSACRRYCGCALSCCGSKRAHLELAKLVLQDDTACLAQFLKTCGCALDRSLGNGCKVKWLPCRIKFDACRQDCWYEAIDKMKGEAMIHSPASAATSLVPGNLACLCVAECNDITGMRITMFLLEGEPATLPHGDKAIALEHIHVDFTSFGTKPLPRRSS